MDRDQLERTTRPQARIVHEGVEHAPVIVNPLSGVCDLGGIGDVEDQRHHMPATGGRQ